MKSIDWKQMFSGRKDQWLILLLVGILLIVIAMPTEKSADKRKEGEESVSVQSGREAFAEDTYTRLLERHLAEVLGEVKGVGRVSVMITCASSSERVVEKDRETTSRKETGENGGKGAADSSSSETSVYAGEAGSEIPYVKKELSPEIEGVLVIAEGGDNAVVIEQITEAVQALFGVDTHKIKVMKRK